MIAGIETGGTKVICAVADPRDPGTLVDRVRIDTTTPERTLGDIRNFLAPYAATGGFDAVGIASFGPVEVDSASPRYGWITSTPKPGWRNTDLVSGLGLAEGTPVRLVTDVTGAALGEHRFGAGRGVDDLAYVTVGTGIGAGIVVNGAPFTLRSHPELGHLVIRRHPDDSFAGVCPFHGDCLEGLASGPSVEARWGRPGTDLGPLRGGAVELSAYYIAQLLATVTYAAAPQRIVVGGGVLKTPGLLDAVRQQLALLVGGALAGHPLMDTGSGYVVRPELGDESGVRGALSLARDASPLGVVVATAG
ncbi:ROK family protein [Arthrobacter sp. NPDC092385]|uniref:ROK family protein n=1 Tax=Arthrobacter sp. NPDC092385 TaxID=3363943 RepID=UPI00380E9D54